MMGRVKWVCPSPLQAGPSRAPDAPIQQDRISWLVIISDFIQYLSIFLLVLLLTVGCGVSKLNRLQLLRVDNNLLTKITPEMFSGSADLVHLDLGNNHLVQFKCGHMLPGVTHLNLSYNQLSSFPEDILQCTKVSGCCLLVVYYWISSFFCHGQRSQLEELDVSGNPLMAVKPLKTLKV